LRSSLKHNTTNLVIQLELQPQSSFQLWTIWHTYKACLYKLTSLFRIKTQNVDISHFYFDYIGSKRHVSPNVLYTYCRLAQLVFKSKALTLNHLSKRLHHVSSVAFFVVSSFETESMSTFMFCSHNTIPRWVTRLCEINWLLYLLYSSIFILLSCRVVYMLTS